MKHEAMAIRRARQGSVDHEAVDLDAALPSEGRDVEDHIAAGERVDRSVEALRALKPDEAKALMLKAEGLSYDEIGRRFGWTYTKVNRSITEGRARFMKLFRRIEAGEACESYADALAALAGGSATQSELLRLRPHLRHCATCRAVVRELRLSRGRRVALFAPWVVLRVAGAVRHHAASAYNRAVDPTPLAGVRPGALAAAVAGCLAAGGGATYCIEARVDPIAGLSALAGEPQRHPPKPRVHRRAHPKPTHHVKHAVPTPRPIIVVATATPTPTPTATVTHEPIHHATATPAPPAPTPTAPPPAPQDEFQPSSTHATTTHTTSRARPAPAPAGGAGEFDGP